MKKYIVYTLAVLALFLSYGCEEVVDIPLQNTNPKLVIDAVIKWQKGTSGNQQTIKLSTTNDFYSNTIAPATGATVSLTNTSNNTVFNFIDAGNTGDYVCANFAPIINQEYLLKIEYQGQTYTSTEKLYPTPSIQKVEQKLAPGIGNKENIQLKAFFQDNGLEDNFYLVGVENKKIQTPEFGVITDEFFQGNLMFGFYANEDLISGDKIPFYLQSISASYYNYMSKLLNLSGGNGGGPFATPPATLRGNIKNQTKPDNYPLGYFSMAETDTIIYTIL